MRTYITCAKRKGNPKVSVEICRYTCKRRKKCLVYHRLQNPSLFPELDEFIVYGTR